MYVLFNFNEDFFPTDRVGDIKAALIMDVFDIETIKYMFFKNLHKRKKNNRALVLMNVPKNVEIIAEKVIHRFSKISKIIN